ncbi:hypothetical protein CU098_005275, partial [Rhizopus stolonifer]
LIPNQDSLPTAQLKPDATLSAYYTPQLASDFSVDVDLIWSLATAFQQDPNAIHGWIRDLIQPGLASQLERITQIHADDPFASTFVHLSYGQRDLAAEQAQQHNDYPLGMYIVHAEFKDLRDVIQSQIASFQSKGEWQTMSVFHRKCWCIMAGDLGYVPKDDFVVTSGVYWQCALGMYLWYGNRYGTQPSLAQYNKAFSHKPDVHHLQTVRHTAVPDASCLWYQLLQLLIGDASIADLAMWPLDLVWLMGLYRPQTTIDQTWLLKWIDQLELMDLAEWAIYASLPTQKVNSILRQCEWQNEARLLNEFYIPKKQIQIAKALHAHDAWDYEQEYNHLIQGELYDQAKLALFYFLLPKLFQNHEKDIQASIDYIEAIPKDKQDDQVRLMCQAYHHVLSNNNQDSHTLKKELDQLKEAYPSRNVHGLIKDLIIAIELNEQ